MSKTTRRAYRETRVLIPNNTRACGFLSIATLCFLLPAATPLAGQSAPASASGGEEGIPVTDALVIAKCGSCHTRDDRGDLQRISWTRATPEGWQDVLRRMILANGLSLTPPEARLIVKYLSSEHGLAPAEARPVTYIAERRIHDETGTADDGLRAACGKCHAIAVPMSWRRSPGEWKRFLDTHAVDKRFSPSRQALDSMVKAAPLHSPDWEAWKGRTTGDGPFGRWLVTASIAGHGRYYGEMQVDRAADGEFTTHTSLTSVRDGSRIIRAGRAVAYGGYAWRGRSSGERTGSAPADPLSEAREVLWIAPDGSHAEGRWFWGQYQEFGFDVQLRRASSGPTLITVDRSSMKAGTQAQRVRLIGENFPAGVTASDINFGPGLAVRRIVSSSSSEIVVELDVAAEAQSGRRDVAFRGSILPQAVAVYDRVDYIRVVPESAVASFGDSTHQRGYVPFEAIGYERGPDGRLHTADDVELGPVDVAWSMQVFHAPDGSHADSVGNVDSSGLLIPASADPGNNFDVWAIATAKDEKDRNGAPLVGKSYVVVAVPEYTFNGRRYVRDLDRWIDDGPASEKKP